MSTWTSENAVYTDYSTGDLGDTLPIYLSVEFNTGNIELNVNISEGTWDVNIFNIMIF
jgi:hypothetical protein